MQSKQSPELKVGKLSLAKSAFLLQARGNFLVSGSGDRTLRLWQLDSGDCRATLEGHRDAVTCLTLAGESGEERQRQNRDEEEDGGQDKHCQMLS